MVFQPPIKIRNHGKGHSYRDANDVKVPGVTTIIKKGFPAAALIPWAAGAVAACALDEWDKIADMRPSTRYAYLKGAPNRDRDAAANRGTQVHKLAIPLAHGESVEVPELLTAHVDSYIRFLNYFHVKPVHLELTVVNHKYGYGGRLDLIGDLLDPVTFEWKRWLLDLKTSRSGIFLETLLQLAGYWGAENIVIETMEGKTKKYHYEDMPEVDAVGAVWIRQDGVDLIPLDPERMDYLFDKFLHVKEGFEFTENGEECKLEAIPVPMTDPDPED
jgi:hypothetical protein